MSVLTFEQIEDIVKAQEPNWINTAKKESKVLNVHINGVKVSEHLEQIEGFENETQKKLRKNFATSNRFVFANLLRPVDKVFSAKGGTRIITKKEDQVKELLSDVRNGMSLKKWIMKIQANKYYSDPAGLVFFEWKDNNTWPTIKSIHDIKDYKCSGRRPEWVCFMPEEINNSEDRIDGQRIRLVDDAFDYMLLKKGELVQIIEDETYANPWGYVPAVVNSDLPNHTLKYNESPVQDIIDIAEHYLRTTSVKNIYEFLHGYPLFWMYAPKCKTCNGTGEVNAHVCPDCKGSGLATKKDVSDVHLLRPPTDEGQPVIAPNVAGYVQPDLETWREQREELKWLWKLMQFTLWGTLSETRENETATAAFLDVQPVNDRLNKFSDSFEDLSQKMINIIVGFHFGLNEKGKPKVEVSENFGRRFLMEPPDTIWKKYLDAKEKGAPKITLDYLLLQYYQTEFADDINSLAILSKGMWLEPFVHKTDEEVLKFPITGSEKIRKIYFNEWWQSLDDNHVIMTEFEKLNKEFIDYLKDKNYEESKNLPPEG